jgi:hypothetical protein
MVMVNYDRIQGCSGAVVIAQLKATLGAGNSSSGLLQVNLKVI